MIMDPMKTFRHLRTLLKDAGHCTYVQAADAVHGTMRHTLTFQPECTTYIPCLNDGGDLAMRYSEARVGWQMQGHLYGHQVDDEVVERDPAIFFARMAAKTDRETRGLLEVLKLLKGCMPLGDRVLESLTRINTLRPEWVTVEAVAPEDDHEAIVGGALTCNDVTVYISPKGFGFYEQQATHLWDLDLRAVERMEIHARKHAKDVRYIAEEAIKAISHSDKL